MSYLSLVAGLLVIAFMAWMVWLSYTPLLWVDQWAFLHELIGNHGHYGAALIWKQHNEHRMPVAKLFYLIDLYVFHGTNVFLLVLIFCTALLHVAWLAFVYARVGKLSAAAWRMAVGLTAVCLFAFRQNENFFFGSDLPVVLPYVGATIAISSLGMFYQSRDDAGRRKAAFLVLSWVAALIASLSLTNGILLWPILLLLTLVWRLPRRVTVATAALGAGFVGLWSIGYSFPTGLLHWPINELARFVLLVHTTSWTCIGERNGLVPALVGIPSAVCAFVWVLWKRHEDVFAIVLLSIGSFALMSSFTAALGRLVFGLAYARSDRYQTGALLFWCCLFVLIIRLAARSRRSQLWLICLQVMFVGVLISAATHARASIDDTRMHRERMKMSAAALDAGVKDTPSVHYPIVLPWTADDLMLLSDYLRSRGWSIFAHGERYPLGRQFNRYYRVASPGECACLGDIESITGIADSRWPGFRFVGWAWNQRARAPGKAVALVDSTGRLIGIAGAGYWRPDVLASKPEIKRDDTGFFGYVPGDLEAPYADAFLISPDNVSACPFSSHRLTLDLASTIYTGPLATGVTRNLIRDNFPARGVIETLGSAWVASQPKPVAVPAGQALTLTGWIVDPARRAGAAADVALDGVPLRAQYGSPRPSVASRLSSSDATRCGLFATLPNLSLGEHTLALRVVSRDREMFFEGLPLKIVAR
jgi:hypothetical protein